MLKNLSIRQKLLLVTIIPFVLLVVLSYSTLMQKQKSIENSKKILTQLEFTTFAFRLIKAVQNERLHFSLSKTILVDSNTLLKNCYEQTQNVFDTFEKFIKNHKEFDNETFAKQLLIMNKIKDLRIKGINNHLSRLKLINEYENIIENITSSIANIQSLSLDSKTSLKTLGLINLLQAQQYAVLERGVTNSIFIQENFRSKNYSELKAYSDNFQVHLHNFLDLASIESRNFYLTQFQNTQANVEYDFFKEFIYNKIFKDEILSNIKALVGYGGLIDHYKSYLITKKEKEKKLFLQQFDKLLQLIQEYKQYKITEEEIELLSVVQVTFNKYKQYLLKLDQFPNTSLKEFIAKNKVYDTPAILALERLESNIIGVDSDKWFKVSTNRIEHISQTIEFAIKELANQQLQIKQKLQNQLLFEILLTLCFLAIVLTISFIVFKDIVFKIKTLQTGLLSFFSYVNKDSKEFNYLNVDGNDEFNEMFKVLNKSISQTAIHIEEEIQSAANKERQLQESAKLAQMGEMIGNIAHQWRQPLSVISTAASGIKLEHEYGLLNDTKLVNYCDNIEKNTIYLSQTIDIFRDFIKEKKEKKNVILQDRIDKAIKIVLSTLENYHIKLINNINYNEPISMNLVIGELSQVIINLINNAKDAILQNKIDNGWIKLECTKDDQFVYITIEDNALGIPLDIMDKIFEPYFTTKHQSKGTGLGLHMSYNIITKTYKGEITASNTDVGAKFTIKLPLDQ
ncbi:MAG: nitrate- and nitrite sensing domain-containing protein [Campylobacterales bacterium]|nr:nitrate- and nitrite sensing domain-containing protein [Campylobacterales bacterium]